MSSSCQISVHNSTLFVNLMHSVTDIARKFRNIEFELDFKLDFELDFWLNYLKIRRKSLCLLLEEEESRKS